MTWCNSHRIQQYVGQKSENYSIGFALVFAAGWKLLRTGRQLETFGTLFALAAVLREAATVAAILLRRFIHSSVSS